MRDRGATARHPIPARGLLTYETIRGYLRTAS